MADLAGSEQEQTSVTTSRYTQNAVDIGIYLGERQTTSVKVTWGKITVFTAYQFWHIALTILLFIKYLVSLYILCLLHYSLLH